MFYASAMTSNRLDDFLNFYCDVYGHNDACFRYNLDLSKYFSKCFPYSRDLIRGKLVNLFKTEFRSELLGKHLSVEDRKMVKETGLLGGNIALIFSTFLFSFPRGGEGMSSPWRPDKV